MYGEVGGCERSGRVTEYGNKGKAVVSVKEIVACARSEQELGCFSELGSVNGL